MEPRECSKCLIFPEDILMMACSHDLCLDCSSERYKVQQRQYGQKQCLICQFCKQQTPLDNESIEQLKKSLQPFNSSTYDNKTNQETQYKSMKQIIDPGVSGHQNIKNISRISNNQCKFHPDEEILYFCFHCICQCICPQCVIHGKHKDHQVMTVRKAAPIIKKKLEAFVQKSTTNIEQLLLKKYEVEKNIKIIKDSTQQSKNHLRNAFEQVRKRLQQQQQRLLDQEDRQSAQLQKQLQRYLSEVGNKINLFNSIKIEISKVSNEGQIEQLNYYSSSKPKIQQTLANTFIYIKELHRNSNDAKLASVLDLIDDVSKLCEKC